MGKRGFSLIELAISMVILAIAMASVFPLIATSHRVTEKTFSFNAMAPSDRSSVNDAAVEAETVIDFLSGNHANNTCLNDNNYTCAERPNCCSVYGNRTFIRVFTEPFNGSPHLRTVTVEVEFEGGNYTLKQIIGIWQ